MNARRGIFVAPFEELSEPGLVQGPPIPVWVAARWPHRRPLRRAARFDGLFPDRPARSRRAGGARRRAPGAREALRPRRDVDVRINARDMRKMVLTSHKPNHIARLTAEVICIDRAVAQRPG
ncbi:MAG: hypothetical protein ACRDLA_12040 [Thermoleophilaceae bacterium]